MFKVNLGLATMLALMVLMGIVADRLPKTSEIPLLGEFLIPSPSLAPFYKAPFLGYYVLAVLTIFALSVILETIVNIIFGKMIANGDYPPDWLYKLTRRKKKVKDHKKGVSVRFMPEVYRANNASGDGLGGLYGLERRPSIVCEKQTQTEEKKKFRFRRNNSTDKYHEMERGRERYGSFQQKIIHTIGEHGARLEANKYIFDFFQFGE